MDKNTPLSEINPTNIIVRMPNWLGDLVMATPILADLRHHWPKAKITAMCQGGLGTIIEKDPHLDAILQFNRPKGWMDNKSRDSIISPLKQGNYDLGILLTNSFSSAWWFWKGGVKNRLGFKGRFRSTLLDFPVAFNEEYKTQHLVKTYKKLLSPLNIPLSRTAPQLYLSSDEMEKAKNDLQSHGIQPSDLIIGINPGAAFGSAKCWLPDRFQTLTENLLENPIIKVIYFGDKAGAPLVHEICSKFPERVINLAGKTTLRELIAMIQKCHLFLTNDSGPMHVASALGTPLVALFGSTSDVATGPYNGGLVIHKHVPCSPCYRRECPIDFRCMKEISIDEVYESIQKILK